MGLPSAELAPDKVPQPWGLATPLQGPFPVGPGEDDSAPREGREARPAQGAQGRAGSQAGSGTEQAGVFVLCPMSHAGTRGGGGVTQGPYRLNCQEGAGSGSQAWAGILSGGRTGAGARLP